MADDLEKLAYWYMSLLDGDTHNIDAALAFLKKKGFLNEFGEWEYDE